MSLLPPKLLSSTLVSAVGRVIGTALSVATIGVVTQSLAATGGVASYGAYATIFAFLGVVAVVADGGLYLVFTKEAARLDSAREALLFKTVLRVRLGALLFVLLAVSGAVTLLKYPLLVRQGILLGSCGVAAQLIAQLTLGVFQKRLRMSSPAAGEIIGRGVTFGLAMLFASSRGGVLLFVGAFVVGTLVTLFWNMAFARRLLPASFVPSVGNERPPTWPIVREAWPLGLLLVFWMVVFRADSVLLSYLRPLEDVGWYALPYKVLESLLFFPAMIGGLLFPVLSRSAAAASDLEGFRRTLGDATDLFLFLAFPTVILLVLSAPSIIHVLGGGAFAPSVPVLKILAVALGALFFGNLYGNGAIALGAQKPLLAAAIVLAAGNIAVNLVVIPRFSFLGAAWTTLSTELLSALVAGHIVLRRIGFLPTSSQRVHILSAGGVFLLITLIPLPDGVRALVGMLGYIGALSALGVLTPERLRALIRSQRQA